MGIVTGVCLRETIHAFSLVLQLNESRRRVVATIVLHIYWNFDNVMQRLKIKTFHDLLLVLQKG